MSGSPLTLEERYLIQAGFAGALPFAQIADELGRHRSVIYDEHRRGGNSAGHDCPHRAQQHRDAASARSAANAPCKPAGIWTKVKAQIKAGWSAQQISGRRALLNDVVPISTQAVYNAAERYGWRQWLYTAQLRQHLKRPARHPWNGTALPIQERAKDVMLRIDIGHWEADTARGKQKDALCTLVMIERQSLYMQLVLLRSAKALPTARFIKRRLEHGGVPFESVTTDRGTEFRATGDVLPGKAYVCDPYAPNQRGTNENQIGMLRVD